MSTEYRDEPKYKRYEASMERTLLSFETISEWADIIAFLARLTKTINSFPMFEVIPNKLLVSKRLAQCLNPNLPSGVHQRTLETYSQIFEKIRMEGLSHDLALYSAGLLSFFGSASSSIKLELLCIIEKYFLPLEGKMESVLSGILFAICTGFEDEVVESMPQFEQIFIRLNTIFGEQKVNNCVWTCLKLASIHRNSFLSYFIKRYPLKTLDERKKAVIFSPDYSTAIDGICHALEDSSLFVVRLCLDLVLSYIPFHSLTDSNDSLKLIGSCLKCFSKKDASINRRIFSWISLDSSNHCDCEIIKRSIIYSLHHSSAPENIRPVLRSLMFLTDQNEWLRSIVAPVAVDILIFLYQNRDLYANSAGLDFFKQMDLSELWRSIGNKLTSSEDGERFILIDSLIYAFGKYKICEDEGSWVLMPLVLDKFTTFIQNKSSGESPEGRLKTLLFIKEALDYVKLAVFDEVSLDVDIRYNSTCAILRNIARNLTTYVISTDFCSLELESLEHLSLILKKLRGLIPAHEIVLDETISSRLIQFFTEHLDEKCNWESMILCMNIILDVCNGELKVYCCLCDVFMENLWKNYNITSKRGLDLLWRFNQLIPSEVDLNASRRVKLSTNVPKFIHLWQRTIVEFQEDFETCRMFPNSIRLLLDTLVGCLSPQTKLALVLGNRQSSRSVIGILLDSWFECYSEESGDSLDGKQQQCHLLMIFTMIVREAPQFVHEYLLEDYLAIKDSLSMKTPDLLMCYDKQLFPFWLVVLQISLSLMVSNQYVTEIQTHSQNLCIIIIEKFSHFMSPRIAKSLHSNVLEHFKVVGMVFERSLSLVFDTAYIISRFDKTLLGGFTNTIESIVQKTVSIDELKVLMMELVRRGCIFDDVDFHKICKATISRLSSLLNSKELAAVFAPELFFEALIDIFIVSFDQFKAFKETNSDAASEDTMSLAGKLRLKLSNPPAKYIDCSGIVLLPDLLGTLKVSQAKYPEYFKRREFVSKYDLFIQRRLSITLSSLLEQGAIHIEKCNSFKNLYGFFPLPAVSEQTLLQFLEESGAYCQSLKEAKYNDPSKTWESVLIFVHQIWNTSNAKLISKSWGSVSVLMREVVSYSNKFRNCTHAVISLCAVALELLGSDVTIENSLKMEVEDLLVKIVDIVFNNSTKVFEVLLVSLEEEVDVEQPLGTIKDRNGLKCCYSLCYNLLPKVFANGAKYSTSIVTSCLVVNPTILMPLLKIAKRPKHSNQMVKQSFELLISRHDNINLWRKDLTEMFQADYFWDLLSLDPGSFTKILDGIRELLRLDPSKLQDLTAKSPSTGSNIFLSKDLDRINRALTIRRVALAVLCSSIDSVKSIISEIQEMYAENLRSDQYSTSKEALLLLRCIVYKIGNEVSSSFWPILLSFSLNFIKGLMKVETLGHLPRKQISILNQICLLRRQIVSGKLYTPLMSLLPLMGEVNEKSLFFKLKAHFNVTASPVYEDSIYLSTFLELQTSEGPMKTVEICDFYSDLVGAVEQD